MLHSDDVDINKVIREIIDLDTKAINIGKTVKEKTDKLLDQTKNEIKEREKAEIEAVQELTKKNYQLEIAKAKDERLTIIHSMEQELDRVRSGYNEKKDEKAVEVLEILFKNPLSSI